MSRPLSIPKLADDIRKIYTADRLQAEPSIETYLESMLRTFSDEERVGLLEKLTEEFNGSPSADLFRTEIEEEILTRLFALVLGRKVSKADLSSKALLERLGESLNTIFDILNQLIKVINSNLYDSGNPEETIRQLIAVHLKENGRTQNLESYLGQISKAFLSTHEAFKKAAYSVVGIIFTELAPDQIISEVGGRFKPGPLRKAESFDKFEEKFGRCKKWFESGRFMEDLLKEFENNCQQKSL